MSKLKQAEGFTLIELLVVMMIIGLLVGLLAPNLMGTWQNIQYQQEVRNVSATLHHLSHQAYTQNSGLYLVMDEDRLSAKDAAGELIFERQFDHLSFESTELRLNALGLLASSHHDLRVRSTFDSQWDNLDIGFLHRLTDED